MEENSEKWSKVVEDDSQTEFLIRKSFFMDSLETKDWWFVAAIAQNFVCVFFGVSMNNRFIGKLTFYAKITKLWFLLERSEIIIH